VPSIRERDIACAEWSDVRSLEHFLQLLDVINNALNIHATAVYRTNFLGCKAPEFIVSGWRPTKGISESLNLGALEGATLHKDSLVTLAMEPCCNSGLFLP
jgi:hypothetical protein